MKKKITILLLGLCVSMLAGCGIKEEISIDKSNKISGKVSMYLTDEEVQMLVGESGDTSEFGSETTINGVHYYVTEEKLDAADVENLELSCTEFVASASDVTEMADVDDVVDPSELGMEGDPEEIANQIAEMYQFIDISITFPYKVISTNGKISKDGKTVTFEALGKNKNDKELFAYTAKSDKLISLSDILNDKYTAKKSINVTSAYKVKSVTVNGKKQTSKKISLKKDGEYTIKVVTDKEEKTFKIYKDSKKPEISGVNNKASYDKAVTLKVSDKDSGIASLTVNGKEIKASKYKNGYKVSKAGSYCVTVTDKAGNTKTVSFTIE